MSENAANAEDHTGGCLCGDVRYQLRGNPLLLTICYCTFCQRATGSSHLVEPIWKEEAFAFTSGKPEIFRAVSRGSSKQITISFCQRCGTKLCQSMERFAGVIGIYAGTLDHPDIAAKAAETWRIFVDDAPKGTSIPAGVKFWRQHRLASDGTPNDPIVLEGPHTV